MLILSPMPFCPSSLPARPKINIISKPGCAHITSFYRRPNIIWSIIVSTIPSSQVFCCHRLGPPGGKEIRMQEVYEGVSFLSTGVEMRRRTIRQSKKLSIHASAYTIGVMSWDDVLELSRGRCLHIFTSVSGYRPPRKQSDLGWSGFLHLRQFSHGMIPKDCLLAALIATKEMSPSVLKWDVSSTSRLISKSMLIPYSNILILTVLLKWLNRRTQ